MCITPTREFFLCGNLETYVDACHHNHDDILHAIGGVVCVISRLNSPVEMTGFLQPMITMKFGGSSVGTADAIRQVAAITKTYLEKEPILVVSALYGTTDLLVKAASLAERGEEDALKGVCQELRKKHHDVLAGLGVEVDIDVLLDECEHALKGVCYLRELSPSASDLILSFGERLSSRIVAGALRDAGVDGLAIDARDIIATDDNHGSARVDHELTRQRARNMLLESVKAGRVPVVTGFIASSPDRKTTTLGRGGSDYTASILGASVDADEIWIWKEVDGILTADPRIVPGAKRLSEINYEEAAEMSHFGAKVLHPKTMIPAITAGIPIRMRNTFRPSAPGTVIGKQTAPVSEGVKVVSAIKGLSMITIEGKGMAGIAGFAAQLFSAAGRLKINIVMFTQSSSEQVICLVVSSKDGKRLKDELEDELNEAVSTHAVERIHVEDSVSAVAVVGDGMRGRKGIAGKVFTSIAEAGVSALAIAQGSSERNISFIVREEDADNAVRALHQSFRLHQLEPSRICEPSR